MRVFLSQIYDDYICFAMRRGKRILLLLAISFAAGFLTGLLFGGRGLYADIMFLDSVEYSVQIFAGRISVFTIIFRGIFINLRYFILVWFCSLCVWLLPLNFLFIAFKGYVFGAAIIVFTNALGVHGFASVLIIVLPQQFILIFSLMLYISFTSHVTASYNKSFICARQHLKTCGVYFCISLCNIIIELILLYVIIKPFNILI